MQGQAQSSDTALELFNLLSSSDTKLRQPVGLEMQLMQDMRMDSDVSKSMLQLLQVCLTFNLTFICSCCYKISAPSKVLSSALYEHDYYASLIGPKNTLVG